MNQTLQKLIKVCWSDFKKLEKEHPGLVVQNSIPILWFGDIDAYFESKKRILTVALNPSYMEFMEKKGQIPSVEYRFPSASKIVMKDILNNDDCEIYKRTMCEYFHHKKYYSKFFNRYNFILSKLETSYGGRLKNEINTAIHIDIHTPVATSENWGDVSDEEKDIVKSAHSISFEDLFNFLNPDLTLISCNMNEVKKIPFITEEAVWSKKSNLDNEYVHLYKLNNGKALISGLNMRGTPFGGHNDFYDKAFAEMMEYNNIFDL